MSIKYEKHPAGTELCSSQPGQSPRSLLIFFFFFNLLSYISYS